jgi:hypothetical protein
MAESQAKRDSAGSGRTAAGRAFRAVECQAGEPLPLLAVRVAQHPRPDRLTAVDHAPARDDAAGQSLPSRVRSPASTQRSRIPPVAGSDAFTTHAARNSMLARFSANGISLCIHNPVPVGTALETRGARSLFPNRAPTGTGRRGKRVGIPCG